MADGLEIKCTRPNSGGAAAVPPVFISSSFQGLFPGEDPGVACEAGRISWWWSCYAKGPVIIYRLGGVGGFWAKHDEI